MKNVSAKIEINKFEEENIFSEKIRKSRVLSFYVTVTADIQDDARETLYKIENKMNEYDWLCCYDSNGNDYSDGFDIPFEYGQMTEIKKEVLSTLKKVKKELGIK